MTQQNTVNFLLWIPVFTHCLECEHSLHGKMGKRCGCCFGISGTKTLAIKSVFFGVFLQKRWFDPTAFTGGEAFT